MFHFRTIKTPNGTRRSDTHIKLVDWNAQGEITKTSAIKTAIVQDDLDIVMIQDTRYKHRLDDLPNLRIQDYHNYHRTVDVGRHGLVTIIKNTIRGSGTNTFRTRHLTLGIHLLIHYYIK